MKPVNRNHPTRMVSTNHTAAKVMAFTDIARPLDRVALVSIAPGGEPATRERVPTSPARNAITGPAFPAHATRRHPASPPRRFAR